MKTLVGVLVAAFCLLGFAIGAGVSAIAVDKAAATQPVDACNEPPVVITSPGREFQDDARPGAMIVGMDRTPKGRIWGCWTGTGGQQRVRGLGRSGIRERARRGAEAIMAAQGR